MLHPVAPLAHRQFAPGTAVALTLCLAAPALHAAPLSQDPLEGAREVETKHYAVRVHTNDAFTGDYAAMAEAAFEGFAAELGRKPRTRRGKPVRLHVYADKADWTAGLTQAQVFPPPFFDFLYHAHERRMVLVYGDPSAYFTRQKFIEGAFQNFHYLCKAKNADLEYEWYVTGLADALSEHDWDGETLQLGARRLLWGENRAASALYRNLDERLADAEISEEDLLDVDVRWALTAYLMQGKDGAYREAFRRLALGQKGSMLRGPDFLANLGEVAVLIAEVDAWVRERGQVLRALTGTWSESAGTLRGEPQFDGQLVVALGEEPWTRLDARPAVAPGVASGIALHWMDLGNCTLALLVEGRLRIVQIDEGQELLVAKFFLGEAPLLSARRDDDRVTLYADGERLHAIQSTGQQLALVGRGGEASFTDVAWR